MPLKDLTPAEKDALVEHCHAFIKKQEIRCVETIYQTDRVIENAYEFIDGICAITGFDGNGDDDED